MWEHTDISSTGFHKANLKFEKSEIPSYLQIVYVYVEGGPPPGKDVWFKACVGDCSDTCPSDCSSNGLCMGNSSTCVCDAGYVKDDCSKCDNCRWWLELGGSIVLGIFVIFIVPVLLFTACVVGCIYCCCSRHNRHYDVVREVPYIQTPYVVTKQYGSTNI